MKFNSIFYLFITAVFFSGCGLFENKNTSADTSETDNDSAITLSYTVDSDDERFSIQFPGAPDYTSEPVETESGILENNMYIYEHNISLAYMLAYTDYSTEEINSFDPNELLNNAMNGFTGEVGLTVDNTTKISLKKYPGIEFIASGEGYWAHMRDYLVENRLYQIGLLSTDGNVKEADANAFFNSFVLK